MLDLICVALLAVLPVLILSIYAVRFRKKYQWHKRVQLVLGVVLLLTVVAFEVDIRFITDWQELASPSPYFEPNTWNLVWYSLIFHLCFAIPTLFLWSVVLVQAVRRFPTPPAPGKHSGQHTRWARLAVFGMVMTAVSGWVFYWLAFVA